MRQEQSEGATEAEAAKGETRGEEAAAARVLVATVGEEVAGGGCRRGSADGRGREAEWASWF